jgi:methionyl-tRNA formyltransferase
VAAYALQHGLPLWQTSSLRGADAEARLRAVNADAMALAAFAALVPANILDLAPRGILNVHPSLLPRWRGASPIQAALLAGDPETGVSIIRLVRAMDAGPILLQQAMPISADDDYLSLERRLAGLGAEMLVRALAENPPPRPQDDAEATYCKRIEREDAHIDWSQPADAIWRQVRAYRGWPQAFTTFDRRLLKVLRATPLGGEGATAGQEASTSSWERAQTPPEERDSASSGQSNVDPGMVSVESGVPVVATGHGRLRLDLVQLEGRRAVSGEEFARGYPHVDGAKLAWFGA